MFYQIRKNIRPFYIYFWDRKNKGLLKMMKNVYKATLIALAGLIGSANALEVRPLAQIQFPGKDKVAWENHGNKDDTEVDADLVFEIGTELLATSNYFHYGMGLAYRSAQKKGNVTAAPASIPVWLTASVGLFNKQAMFQPYAVARFGTLAPLSSDGNWWESPLNYMVEGGAGVLFPYNIGLEVVYDYSSLKKSFESMDTEFRISSGRIGIQLSVGISLSGDESTKAATPGSKQTSEPMETAQSPDSLSSENGQGDLYASSAAESEPEQTDTTAADSAPDIPPESPDPTSDTVATETTETTEPTADESEQDSSATEPAQAESTETAEPETAAEPEPKPEAEPAPEPESKPAAKKISKKATKKASKKPSKKSTKKATKKSNMKNRKKK